MLLAYDNMVLDNAKSNSHLRQNRALERIYMKNYLEHETEVKFIDGILSKSQEWQWFINCVETDFELEDVSTYEEFKQKNGYLRRLLGNFLKMLEVSDKELEITKPILLDIYNISRFSIGAATVNETQNNTVTNFGRILLVIVWMTKMENTDNETDYIVDMRFLSQKNLFQAIKMESFITEEDSIIEYLNSISMDGFDEPRKCIIDNLKKVPYDKSDDFFEVYGNNLLSANAFSYQFIKKNGCLTWQEDTLLDMLAVSINKRTISPTYTIGKTVVPDYKNWTSDLINQLKLFFNNPIADFVLESMDYVKNGVIPSKSVIDAHCRFLKELIESGNDYETYSSSTYTIIASMFSDGSMNSIDKNGDVLDLIKCIHKVKSITLLLKLKEDHYPISKEQRLIVNQYIAEQYKGIENIDTIFHLKDYLENKDIAKHITQPYYDLIMPKFLKMLDDPRQQMLPTLFYQAMLFLLEVNQTNQQVDRRIVKKDMIVLQECWQNNIYEEQCKNLQEFRYGTSIKTEDVEKFNGLVLANPILIARNCLLASTDDMIKTMESMSKHAIAYMIKKMVLSPIYPVEGAKVNFDNHEIDTLLKTQVDEIKDKYGYRFLNVLDTDVYVSGLHERYREYASTTVSMFSEVEQLYEIVESLLGIKLIPYEQQIQLGHLTQLFPLLEIQIRKLGKMLGIVPFKEKATEFMKYKDPSSVLREMLEEIYAELGSFENVPDFLFVYHFMYNGNSLNIRNECIHGRNYIEGNQLGYAFKVTLLSLYMIMFRIKVIEDNYDEITNEE